MILEQLQKTLATEPCPFTGCIRANKWSSLKWRSMRGDSLLAWVGEKLPIETPYGNFDVYAQGPHLLQFRGGQFRDWWIADCQLLCALVSHFSSLQPDGVALISELDGELREYYIDALPYDAAHQLVELALQQWKVDGRIAKNSPRAAMCTYCSVKRRCDAKDLEDKATQDWPPQWKIG